MSAQPVIHHLQLFGRVHRQSGHVFNAQRHPANGFVLVILQPSRLADPVGGNLQSTGFVVLNGRSTELQQQKRSLRSLLTGPLPIKTHPRLRHILEQFDFIVEQHFVVHDNVRFVVHLFQLQRANCQERRLVGDIAALELGKCFWWTFDVAAAHHLVQRPFGQVQAFGNRSFAGKLEKSTLVNFRRWELPLITYVGLVLGHILCPIVTSQMMFMPFDTQLFLVEKLVAVGQLMVGIDLEQSVGQFQSASCVTYRQNIRKKIGLTFFKTFTRTFFPKTFQKFNSFKNLSEAFNLQYVNGFIFKGSFPTII
jgi:hypothetical protein